MSRLAAIRSRAGRVSRVSPLHELRERLENAEEAVAENERLAVVLEQQVSDLEHQLGTLLTLRTRRPGASPR